MEELFIEKYRPDTFEQVKGHDSIVNEIESLTKDENVPHMLLYGPPGTGKTTLATVIAKELYGEYYERNFKEMNASDESGIDTIRNEVKQFAQSTGLDTSHKIIFLDEADALSKNAQQALRRMMEQYSNKTRFILSCNYPEQIIDAIKSRTNQYNISKLNPDALRESINEVCEDNDIEITDEAKRRLIRKADGDMREILKDLQRAMTKTDDKIEANHIIEDKADTESKKVISNLKSQKFQDARESANKYLNRGYSERDLIRQIYDYVIQTNDLSDKQKAIIVNKLAEADANIVQGATKRIQLNAIFYRLMKLFD